VTPVDRRRRIFAAMRVSSLAAFAVLGGLSCAAPTLPLPPPTTPTVLAVGPELYRLRGERSAEPLAIVILYKRDLSLPQSDRVDAAEADAEGSWEKTIHAKPGTLVDIWQESGSTRSPPITLALPAAAP
jgi:hypothetical protein